jgi:protein SCO1
MTEWTRRAWLAGFALAPVGGALAAWAQPQGATAEVEPAAPKKPRLSPRERIQRNHLPDIALTTHDGRSVRFYRDLVKDRKIVLNFFYGECQGICVPVTERLVEVQKKLGGRVGRDIFFYSITLDPEHDSPDALQAYAKQHRIGPGWLLLTGTPADVEKLRRALGFADRDPAVDADRSSHTGMIRYGVEVDMRWGSCPGLARPEQILRTILWDLDAPELSPVVAASTPDAGTIRDGEGGER